MAQMIAQSILQPQELAFRPFLEKMAKENKITVDQFLIDFARKIKEHPPKEGEIDQAIRHVTPLRVSREDQGYVAKTLANEADPQLLKGVVAVMALAAFVAALFEGMPGPFFSSDIPISSGEIAKPVAPSDQPPILPEGELNLKPYIEQEARKSRKSVEQFLDKLARDAEKEVPSEKEIVRLVELGGMLRIVEGSETELVAAMKTRGLTDTRLLQAVVAAIALGAFMEPIMN